MFPPFVQQIVGVLVRMAILWIAAKFGAEVSDDQMAKILAQVVPVLLVAAWSIYQKYKGRQKQMVAQSWPSKLTEHEVESLVQSGAPSVNTRKNEVPQ